MRVQNITKQLGEKKILSNISFELRGKERVLLSGENGSGKTTLLKIISGDLSADSGTIKIGEHVHIGYFAQEHEQLDLNKTVLEEFLSLDRPIATDKDPRTILGSFMFGGQATFKKVADLSHGERVRLIFAKLTNQQNELLILDEPTNHLDIVSREIIENAIREYNGAIILVSHDRYFIEQIAVSRTITIRAGTVR